MKRHTFMSDGYYAISGEENFDDQDENYCGAAIDKLAEYEDAEEQGRLIILPCKIGDVVWALKARWRKEDGVVPYQITNLTITQNKKGVWTKKYRAMWIVDGKTRDWSVDFAFDEIGTEVFFTKEEAELKLCT